MSILHPATTIRHREVDRLVVILDLRSGEYVTLNPVASVMWRGLITYSDRVDQITLVAEAFDGPIARIEADLQDFTQVCLSRGLLQEQAATMRQPPTHERARPPLAAGAWLSLFLTTRSLSKRGFAQTYEDCSRLPRPRIASASERRVSAAVRAFRRAELVFVIRTAPADCLPRSLALWRFLLSVGVPAKHCMGVRRFPFVAHAWTEVDGRVLFDSRERVAQYAEIARM